MVPLLIVIGLLLLSALFSSSELAIMGVPIYKVKKFLKEHPHGHAKADLLLSLRARSERTLIAILIGNNLVNVALSVYAARLGDTLLGSVALSGATAFVMISVTITFLILFFGEIIPKVFATRYALRFALVMAPIIQGVIYLLFPFVYLLEVVIH
jgi:CBS domain containing-hemolysin-like protein